jgi:hypothetical protein
VRSSRPTHEATNCGRPVLLRSSFAATFGRSVAPGVPNKPVLPTAPALPNVDPLDSLRRQTGQSFGSGERRPNGQRVTATAPRGEQESGQRQETTSCV